MTIRNRSRPQSGPADAGGAAPKGAASERITPRISLEANELQFQRPACLGIAAWPFCWRIARLQVGGNQLGGAVAAHPERRLDTHAQNSPARLALIETGPELVCVDFLVAVHKGHRWCSPSLPRKQSQFALRTGQQVAVNRKHSRNVARIWYPSASRASRSRGSIATCSLSGSAARSRPPLLWMATVRHYLVGRGVRPTFWPVRA